MYWWISDPHFGQEKIIKYFNRPFKNKEEMDSTIIKNINDKVDEDDVLYINGDFCISQSKEAPDAPKDAFKYYRQQIKCKNIIFMQGSHDKNNGCKTIIESMVLVFGGKRIYMTHNPKFAKEEFAMNFCGHCHGRFGKFTKLGKKSVIVDLSVENWNYAPVDINQINQALAEWTKNKK